MSQTLTSYKTHFTYLKADACVVPKETEMKNVHTVGLDVNLMILMSN